MEVKDTGHTEIIMPEGRYPATYTIEERTWTYPRWFKKHRTDIDIKVLSKGGIPHEGKGENAWDLGMDGTYGIHMPYTGSLREATDHLALSVIKDRQRHSQLDAYSHFKPEPIEST